MNIDTQKLENLLSEKKLDEARAYINELIQAPLSKEDRGAAIVLFTTTYMKIINDVNSEYKASLQEILDELKEIDKLERSTNEKIDLKKVRAELA